MSSFTKASFYPTGRVNGFGRPIYCVSPGFSFYIGAPTSGLEVVVKDGFLTDLVSDPTGIFEWLWRRKWRWLRNTLESVALCAIVHDRLREDLDFTKPSTDLIFVDALYARKVWAPLTWFLFIAVWTNKSRRRTMPA